jgi:hypothetical protein
MRIWFLLWIVYLLIVFPLRFNNFQIDNQNIKIYFPKAFDAKKVKSMVDGSMNILKHTNISFKKSVLVCIYNKPLDYYFNFAPGFQLPLLHMPALAYRSPSFRGESFPWSDSIQMLTTRNMLKVQVGDNNDTIDTKEALAHELVHAWQFQTYGYFHTMKLHKWIREGYAVFASDNFASLWRSISRKKGFKSTKNFLEKGKRLFSKNGYNYYLYGLMVKHAIEDMNISVDDLHRGKVDYDTVFDSLMKKYNLVRDER